ncbi:MAG TPA: FecR domain-containing protein [Bauldia sp.]|nr:FecR domain-containing protein [Bauldia sp.]
MARLCRLAASFLFLGGAVFPAFADDQYLTVTIGPEQTIRDVADKYLSDPDLWPEILKASGIASVADLHPGMELRIPVNEISAANKALIESIGQIQKANAAGAQIFAPEEIGKAVDLHEQALKKRIEREWVITRDLAVQSYGEATTAIEKSEAQRDQAAEAVVSDRAGAVEGQRPADLSWRGLALRSVLIEEEKVRTLSDSTAQITFRDASRLRLNANSNAVIREMRYDPLKKTDEAKVSLVEGDFYALLSNDADRAKFNVEIPQVNAVIDSGDFWVSNKGDSAKFTNYDDAAVKVAANGGTVTLGKNEGTVVDKGEKPRSKVNVLPPPSPAAPANEGIVYVVSPELSWSTVDGSAGYWLEVASDQNFDHLVGNFFGIEAPKQVVENLAAGEYFWRVSALDGFGLPGERSVVSRFTVSPDNTPPFLQIDLPGDGVIVREASVEVKGESEPGAKVSVAGKDVALATDGSFAAAIVPAEGQNTVSVVATDPAGNKTTRERKFTYMPDTQSVVAFDPAIRTLAPLHFITNASTLSLAGKTTASAKIEVRASDGVRATATADAAGIFQINVPLGAAEEKFGFAVIAPSGFTTVTDIAATTDRDPPAIAFDDFLPQLTATANLPVSGHTEPSAKLTINNTPVELKDGAFSVTLPLRPGENIVEVTATDLAGNVTVEKSTVKLDTEAPALVSSAAAPASSGGKPVLAVEVVASDASGLAKAAPFKVAAGDKIYDGYLRYNKAAKKYQGTVVLPEPDLAGARLTEVQLEDDAGNTKVFQIR